MINLVQLKKKVKLDAFSTYGVGGFAKEFVSVRTVSEMIDIFKYINKKQSRFCVIGNGSNVLFDDEGFDGIVIHNNVATVEWNKLSLHVGAGVNLSRIVNEYSDKSISGCEFLCGIPGTVGGAIFMNAGAFGSSFGNMLEKVSFVNHRGELVEYSKRDLEFSYRYSSFQNLSGAIVSCVINPAYFNKPSKSIEYMLNYRKKNHPQGQKTAGCVFKNVDGALPSAKLIEEAGLKGFCVGGAQVSNKHANFLTNYCDATSNDLLDLIKHVQTKVFNLTGIFLKPEIRHITCRKSDDVKI